MKLTLETAAMRTLYTLPRPCCVGYRRVTGFHIDYKLWQEFCDYLRSRNLMYKRGLTKYVHPTIYKYYNNFGGPYIRSVLAAVRLTQ